MTRKQDSAGARRWSEEIRKALSEDRNLLKMIVEEKRYTITIDYEGPVTTFCLFLERGFVGAAGFTAAPSKFNPRVYEAHGTV